MIKAYAIAAVLTATAPVETTENTVAKAPENASQQVTTPVIVNTNETSLRKWWGGRYGPR